MSRRDGEPERLKALIQGAGDWTATDGNAVETTVQTAETPRPGA
jgi:hypothetical protein